MITIRVKFENGDHLVTQINCSIEDAKSYYLGTDFGFGTCESDETVSRAIDVAIYEPEMNYWECQCKNNYIHHNREESCHKCNSKQNGYNVANKFEVEELKARSRFFYTERYIPLKGKPYAEVELIILRTEDGEIKRVTTLIYKTGITRGSITEVMQFLIDNGYVNDLREQYYMESEEHAFTIKRIY